VTSLNAFKLDNQTNTEDKMSSIEQLKNPEISVLTSLLFLFCLDICHITSAFGRKIILIYVVGENIWAGEVISSRLSPPVTARFQEISNR